MYKIGFCLGDWSHDGHNMSEDWHIECNYNVEQITEAYNKATEKIGLDYANSICADYEEYYIQPNNVEILVQFGIINPDNINKETSWGRKEGVYYFENGTSEYVYLFFKIVKLELPDLIWNKRDLEEEHLNLLHGAAYGLFYY